MSAVCTCGRVERVHPLRDCHTFRSSADPDAATAEHHRRAVTEHQLLSAARRALNRRQYDTALGAVLALLDIDRSRR